MGMAGEIPLFASDVGFFLFFPGIEGKIGERCHFPGTREQILMVLVDIGIL